MTDIIEIESRPVNDIRISEQSISELGNRISLMKEFVSKQLVNNINGDYARIPGTPKPSLLKPGAEKLLLLFNLGFRFTIINQVVDFIIGEVSFLVKCETFRKSDGFTVGEYIAFCSNQEKKYVKQSPADIVNTILKMAEKRALVGVTISVTGASDYFSQDLEDMDRKKTADASKFTDKAPSDLDNFKVSFGKFKDMKLSEIPKKDLSSYVDFIVSQDKPIEGPLKEFIDKAREYLR
jgi:hypothetical protein